MDIRQDQVAFTFHAPVYSLGNSASDKLWFVFHGYGLLASYFIKKFEFLHSDTFIIAPQALSYFYLKGTDGRVGTSWMTTANRAVAIDNYISYLNSIYQSIGKEDKNGSKKISMLGFSQGVSTLIRWVVKSEIQFDKLIMCAGSFPEDIELAKARHIFEGKDCYYLYGDKDPYIKPGDIEKLRLLYLKYGLSVKFIQFEGKHEVPINLVQKL